jgi:mRNA interferase MazF
MEKDFDTWNEEKKLLDSTEPVAEVVPKEGWVWMCTLGVNIGFEQDGTGIDFTRPVLIVKKFNNQMYWVMPLSTKQKPLDFYYNFTDPSGNLVSVIIAQLRIVSSRRFIRDMYKLDSENREHITEIAMGFLGKSKTRTSDAGLLDS